MEEFDVVNKNDEVIGKATRDVCHADPNLIHRAIHFTLINSVTKEILLTRRTHNLKYDGGLLCFLGEHVKRGESWDAAVKRGVTEELGFIPEKWTELGHHIFSLATQTEYVRFFLIEWNDEPLIPEIEEIEEMIWLTESQIERISNKTSEMTSLWVKLLLQKDC